MKQGMAKYTLSTLGRMVAVLLAVSLFTFFLAVSAPIDPVTAYLGEGRTVSPEQREEISRYWGLDKSPAERYLIWLRNALKGDMGESSLYRQPVTQVIGERFKASLALMGTAWVLSGLLGFGIGVLCGATRGSLFDRGMKSFCLLLSSTPTFWLGLLALMLFSVYLGWFPVGLSAPIGVLAEDVTLAQRLHHLVLPALTLSVTGISSIALHTRQKLIDTLESDYVLFARARGENPRQVVLRHGLRNIALPALTLQFASFSELFGGSVLAEQVFSYPGLGSAATQAGLRGDMPLLIGIALFSALFVFTGNLLANILYGVFNPKVREGQRDE